MPQSTSAMLFYLLLFYIIYASYSARKLKDQIWCTYRKRDKTKIEKFVKAKEKRTIFDGGWYDIIPQSITLMLWDKGIHWLLPIWVRTLDYRHNSPKPLDPNTFENDYTPEERAQLDMSDDVADFAKGTAQSLQAKGKKGMLEAYMPMIMLIAVIGIGYMLWTLNQRIDMLGQAINMLLGMKK